MSSLAIKLVAMAAMLLDHTAYMLAFLQVSCPFELLSVFRIAGRVAFPLYAFLLVQGALCTGNKWKYLIRLLILAVLSEVPYDLAMHGSIWSVTSQNIFFTLALGLISIYGIQFGSRMRRALLGWGMAACVTVACAAFAEFVYADYGLAGVATISTMGLAAAKLPCIQERVTGKQILTGCFTLGVFVLMLLTDISEIYAFFGLICIMEYSGRKGYTGRFVQYSCYFFYPIHLLILGLLFRMPQLMVR